MSLWCDRYRPKTFKELDYNLKQAKQLQRMVKEGDFPHLLVWGTNGAGKVSSCALTAAGKVTNKLSSEILLKRLSVAKLRTRTEASRQELQF